MQQFITTQAQLVSNESGQQASAEADLLRLISRVQTLVRGASAVTLKKLGAARLTEIRDFLEAENDALTAAANQVKVLNRSSLSIDDLKALGIERLRQLGAKPVDEFAGYSLNEFLGAK